MIDTPKPREKQIQNVIVLQAGMEQSQPKKVVQTNFEEMEKFQKLRQEHQQKRLEEMKKEEAANEIDEDLEASEAKQDQ